MRAILTALYFCLVAFLIQTAGAQVTPGLPPPQAGAVTSADAIKQMNAITAKTGPKVIDARFSQLEAEIRSLQSNQVNYKVEKDLLKEFYSENISTTNRFISAILAIVTVLAFFGLRDLSSLKNEYQKELREVSKLKGELEADIKNINKDHVSSKERFDELVKSHQSAMNRVKVLELTRELEEASENKKYRKGCKLADEILALDPTNWNVLIEKAHFCARTCRLADAMAALLEAFKIDQEAAERHAIDLMEYQLLSGRNDQALETKNKYGLDNELKGKGGLAIYFDALRCFNDNNLAGLKKLIDSTQAINEAKLKPDDWNFEDAVVNAENWPDGPAKKAVCALIAYVRKPTPDGKQTLKKIGDGIAA